MQGKLSGQNSSLLVLYFRFDAGELSRLFTVISLSVLNVFYDKDAL
jgi:hypothetical protein